MASQNILVSANHQLTPQPRRDTHHFHSASTGMNQSYGPTRTEQEAGKYSVCLATTLHGIREYKFLLDSYLFLAQASNVFVMYRRK